jgi:hypothetical protein
MMEVASKTGDMVSVSNWILAVMLFGLLAPGGAAWLGLKKIRRPEFSK